MVNKYGYFIVLIVFFTAFTISTTCPATELDTNTYVDAPLPDRSKSYKSKGQSTEERLMEIIPYAKEGKYAWNVIDGDVDLYFKNLRADRGNMGVAYTTNYIPFMGEVEDWEMKFSAGEDTELAFKTNNLPLIGKSKYFQLKGSAGDGAKISARYTIALDEL